MYEYILALHVTAIALVVGTLFLQSLAVVMALRLPSPEQQAGVRTLQGRIHRFIYYPILAVAIVTGAWLAVESDAFSEGSWLRWKLVLVVVLIGLGFLVGGELRGRRVIKPLALAVHIAIFLLSAWIIYLATIRPY